MNKKIVATSEETALKELISELNKKTKSEHNKKKIDLYGEFLNQVFIRLEEIEELKSIINEDKKESFENLEELFMKFNSYAFAGFDYYHNSGIDYLKEDENHSTIDVLFNKDQLEKFKKVIDCDKDLDFLSYDNDSTIRYGIWLKKCNANINLIPFTRTEKGISIERDNGIIVELSNNDVEYFFKPEEREYKELGYKKLSKKISL